MAKGKDQSPLFEIIRDGQQAKRGRLPLPAWMRRSKPAAGQEEEPAAPPEPAGESVSPAGSPSAQAPEPAAASEPTDGETGDGHSPGVAGWLQAPVELRPTRGKLLGIAAGGLALLAGAYWAGLEVGRDWALNRKEAYQAGVDSLAEYRQQSPKPGLVPSSVAGVEAGAGESSPSAPPASQGATGRADDPRKPGLNYFRLTTIPPSGRAAGQRAVRFLKRNGVDAALIATNNGALKLIALEGFRRPGSDPEARQYAQRLRRLGRQWEAQHDGSSDWSDMIAEKYKPGSN